MECNLRFDNILAYTLLKIEVPWNCKTCLLSQNYLVLPFLTVLLTVNLNLTSNKILPLRSPVVYNLSGHQFRGRARGRNVAILFNPFSTCKHGEETNRFRQIIKWSGNLPIARSNLQSTKIYRMSLLNVQSSFRSKNKRPLFPQLFSIGTCILLDKQQRVKIQHLVYVYLTLTM